MNRPSRQHRNLLAKIEKKAARSRSRGKKAKRLAKWAETYKELCNDAKAAS
jgi:hypothetical protein